MVARKIRCWLTIPLAGLLAFGLAQPATGQAPPETSDVDKGTMLRVGGSSYPRLIRLAHSGLADGRVLASMTSYVDRAGIAVISESTDDGRTFHQIGEIHDEAGSNELGMCCSTLYELPRRIGNLPKGTLLWAGTAGVGADADKRQSSIRVWRSDDHGRTWSFLSTVVQAAVGPGVWEPEFTVSAQGALVVFYSDDNDPAHDQKMVQARSTDGVHWTDFRETLVYDSFRVRPGMAGVRRLPDGTFVMVYELCNYDPVHICTIWMRTSLDGWDFGNPRDPGIEILSETGGQPLGTPTISWGPSTNRNGRLVLAYQMLANDNGGWAPGNGKTLMVNDNPSDLAHGWREIPAPVQLSNNKGSACRNFSPTVLPTLDGRSLIHVTTDFEKYIGGPCEAFYATGPIDPDPSIAGVRIPVHQLDPRPNR